jgi:hypothetical protein
LGEGVVDKFVDCSSAVVIQRLGLVVAEELDGWETLDAVGGSSFLRVYRRKVFSTLSASISTAPTLMIPSRALASFSQSGASLWQWPHQGANVVRKIEIRATVKFYEPKFL